MQYGSNDPKSNLKTVSEKEMNGDNTANYGWSIIACLYTNHSETQFTTCKSKWKHQKLMEDTDFGMLEIRTK